MTTARLLARWAFAVALGLPAVAASAQSLPAGWIAYYKPGGELFVPHPRGWQVQERGQGAFIATLPGGDGAPLARVYVKPQRLLPDRGVTDLLGRLPREEAALFPQARISLLASEVRERSALGELRFSVNGQPHRGTALAIAAGDGRGALYVISASEREWPAQRQVMAQILKGFAWMPPASAAGTVALPPMQLWRDPNEGAFTVPVPRGWQVEGGLLRPGQIDLRAQIVVASPDGAISVRLGDATVPTFATPHTIPLVGTTAEGSTTSAGMLVLRYLPGQAFLTQFYLPRKFGGLPPAQVEDLPALAAQSFRAAPPPAPYQGRVDAGAVAFDLPTPAGPRRAWYVAVTRYLEVPGLNGSGHWLVDTLAGYVCTPGSEALAQRLLSEMHRGFAWNAQWAAAELRMRGEVAQAVIAHNRAMNDGVARTAEAVVQGLDRAAEERARGVRGEIRVQDGSGQTVVVPVTGSQDYYRVRATGDVVATDRSDLPPFDYDRMWQVQ